MLVSRARVCIWRLIQFLYIWLHNKWVPKKWSLSFRLWRASDSRGNRLFEEGALWDTFGNDSVRYNQFLVQLVLLDIMSNLGTV